MKKNELKDKYISKMAARNIRVVDFDRYKGKWLAWDGPRIIASRNDLRKVTKKAEKITKHPIYEKVPDSWTVVY